MAYHDHCHQIKTNIYKWTEKWEIDLKRSWLVFSVATPKPVHSALPLGNSLTLTQLQFGLSQARTCFLNLCDHKIVWPTCCMIQGNIKQNGTGLTSDLCFTKPNVTWQLFVQFSKFQYQVLLFFKALPLNFSLWQQFLSGRFTHVLAWNYSPDPDPGMSSTSLTLVYLVEPE